MVKAIAKTDRVPSGAVQFGTDWPGLFLRGDHALKVAVCVRELQTELAKSPIADHRAVKFLVELASLVENEVDLRPPAPA
jgi:hypothetical protein